MFFALSVGTVDMIAHCYKWHRVSARTERHCLLWASCGESVQCKVIYSNKPHLFCLAFKLREGEREREEGRGENGHTHTRTQNLISNPTHLLISICSVVFNATYWKNFNGCFAMKSFVILQRAFVSLLCDSPRVLESSRWSRSDTQRHRSARVHARTHSSARTLTHADTGRQAGSHSSYSMADIDLLASWHIRKW